MTEIEKDKVENEEKKTKTDDDGVEDVEKKTETEDYRIKSVEMKTETEDYRIKSVEMKTETDDDGVDDVEEKTETENDRVQRSIDGSHQRAIKTIPFDVKMRQKEDIKVVGILKEERLKNHYENRNEISYKHFVKCYKLIVKLCCLCFHKIYLLLRLGLGLHWITDDSKNYA
ncbi:hypothetical protein O3M35_001048 [Rhynocoris fuscipes]|uniref:Uncharacterized protein n=1 Tax=Rhynocoris fuscipes TaxID=488301 RepID=A0AAW1DNY0_9HEMI